MYKYFYKITIVHSDWSEKIVFVKSETELTIQQATKFLRIICVITEQEYDGDFVKWIQVSEIEYRSRCPKQDWIIKSPDFDQSKCEIFKNVNNADFGDLCYEMFLVVSRMRVFQPKIRKLEIINVTKQQKHDILISQW